jgi:predicted GNAT family N-acyltransferase
MKLTDRHSRSYTPDGLRVLRGAGEECKSGDYWMVGNDHGYAEVQLMRKRDSYHPESFYIEHIVINEAERGNGYGKRLNLLVEEMARKLGSKWIQIDSEPAAVGFWDKMGYTRLDKVYYKDKTAMVKRLEP